MRRKAYKIISLLVVAALVWQNNIFAQPYFLRPVAADEKIAKGQSSSVYVRWLKDFNKNFKFVRLMSDDSLFNIMKFKYVGEDRHYKNGINLKKGNYYVLKVYEILEHNPDMEPEKLLLSQARQLTAMNPLNQSPHLPRLIGMVDMREVPLRRKVVKSFAPTAILFEFIRGKTLDAYAQTLRSQPPSVRNAKIINLTLALCEAYKKTYRANRCTNGDIDTTSIMVAEDIRGEPERVVFVDNDTTTHFDVTGWQKVKGLYVKDEFQSLTRIGRLEKKGKAQRYVFSRDDVYSLCAAVLYAISDSMLRPPGDRRRAFTHLDEMDGPGDKNLTELYRARGNLKRLVDILKVYKKISTKRYALDELIEELRQLAGSLTQPALPRKIGKTKSKILTQI